MFISNLYLFNYRNYSENNFDFIDGINCVLGPNGSGKTNLLDAVYYLCLSKSAAHNQDHLNIKHDEDLMILEGRFENEIAELIGITQKLGERKSLFHDKKLYEKVSDHVGKFPVVFIAPDDTDFVKDGSEKRRKLFDGIMAQYLPNYLNNLLYYKKKLEERNRILKDFADRNYFDKVLLSVYDSDLVERGKEIVIQRTKFVNTFLPIVKKYYDFISENKEDINIIYESEVKEDYQGIFEKNIYADRKAQRTLKGPHKDDFQFQINDFSLKKYGSQGQKKSFILALKLAQFEILKDLKGQKPILLLDDIFDKLDDFRIEKLVDLIESNFFGQIFLSDARPERTTSFLSKVESKLNLIYTN